MKTGVAAFDCFEFTEESQAEIEAVLEAAVAWRDGRMAIYEFSIIGWMIAPGGICSPGYTRYVAFRTTPPTDPRSAVLLEAITELERWRKERLANDVRAAA